MEHSATPSPEAAHHPTPATYIGIFRWLALFTVIELALSFLPASADAIKIPALVAFAVVKATLVVLYYMHLRYDSRWYAVLLGAGVFFALLAGRFLPLVQK